MNTVAAGSFFGVGVGPGDPELLTLKAHRLIGTADVVCYLTNNEGRSHAYIIAKDALAAAETAPVEVPIAMPMKLHREQAKMIYEEAAQKLGRFLEAGRNVVFLCEGDPLFYGSLTYLLDHLQPRYACRVVPGITSPQAAAATLAQPLTCLTDSFVVVSGRHDDAFLLDALHTHASLAIMKVGRHRGRILSLLTQAGRLADARYLEYVGRVNERVLSDVRVLRNEAPEGPYFSLFLVTGRRST